MIKIEIPGRDVLEIEHLVLDYNGTIAVDGVMPEAIRERIARLCEAVRVYVLTADTYGTVRRQCEGLGVEVCTFPKVGAALCKREIVDGLQGGVVCFGNGFNDIQMFDGAVLSVAICEGEGMCAALISHADVLARSGEEALDLLLKPDRLRATLRT